jgi:hypothetical protein
MASPNYSEIVTTTLKNRRGKLADNVTKNNALLYRLSESGRKRPVSGGTNIMEELAYAENGTFKRYSGYETLNIAPSDVLTMAEFNWKQAAVVVSISGLEQHMNSGKDAIIDLLESRIKNAEDTMANNIASDVYSDGTADSGKQIGGLQLLISDLGTGTVGGIDSSAWSFWQNQVYDFSNQSVTPGASTIQSAMNQTYLATKRGSDRVDLIVADATYFRYYWESLQAIQRVTSDKMAQAGFEALKFMGADVIDDTGLCPANHMYFINSKYLSYRPHRDVDMVPADQRFSTNQDAMVKPIFWMGNMTIANRARQGVITA